MKSRASCAACIRGGRGRPINGSLFGRRHRGCAFFLRTHFNESMDRCEVGLNAEFIAQGLRDLDIGPAALPQRADQISVGFKFARRRLRLGPGEEGDDVLIEAHTIGAVST